MARSREAEQEMQSGLTRVLMEESARGQDKVRVTREVGIREKIMRRLETRWITGDYRADCLATMVQHTLHEVMTTTGVCDKLISWRADTSWKDPR